MKKTFTKLIVTILALVTALTFAGCSMFINDNQNVGGGAGAQLPDSQVMSAAVHFETLEDSEREEDFTKAVSTGKSVLLYIGRIRAIIFPKECMGEQYEEVLKMIHTHMPPKKVKIRHIH